MKHFLTVLTLFCLSGSLAYAQKATVALHLDKPQWVVSKYLTGSHFVYAYEADWIYEEGQVIDWMKRAKVGVIRYPGGTVTENWHWDDLNGYAFEYHVKELTGELGSADTWSPKYRPLPKRDPKEFMDVDEYMSICKRVGADAMLGVNIHSGNTYRSVEDSKAEAQRLAEYCKGKGYDVKFFYIGNEGYTNGFHGQKYATAIDEYAAILKKVYPDAQIIADWKYGPREKKRFEHSMELIRMSKSLDIMEYHEKWGVDWGLNSGQTRDEWLAQKPFLYNGQFSEFYERFDKNNQKLGRDVKHAHNEWGLGGMKESKNDYDFTLLTADFFIEIFRHPTYMAACWNLNMGPKPARVFLTDKGQVKLMPPALVYEMVATAMGSHQIPIESVGNTAVYGFATKDEKTQWTQIYLMNKSELPVEVTLDPKGRHLTIGAIQSLVAPGKVTDEKFASPPATITLQPMSFSRLTGKVIGVELEPKGEAKNAPVIDK
jgi:alpha-L-arabinofuranosidase